MRDKEPEAITENTYGTDRFKELFGRIMKADFKGEKACYLAGVRAEESPGRYVGLTGASTYGPITWGTRYDRSREHYCFYPIYDWGYKDVWTAIHKNRWPYCQLYDAMYQYGVPLQKMRVSNVHHETAVDSLYYLQEVEADTWNALTRRLGGINSAGQMQKDAFTIPGLPPMFADWIEYRDYLLENLIPDAGYRVRFRSKFASLDKEYVDSPIREVMARTCINGLLRNDCEHTVLSSFEMNPATHAYRKWRRGLPYINMTYIPTGSPSPLIAHA